MTLLQMRYFLTVCRLQNITHAAAELHIAQSTLSQAIQTIEKETGLNLFIRRGRSILISQDGNRLEQKVSALLREVDAFDEDVREMARQHGKVRLAIPQQMASFMIPRLLKDFCPKHPEIRLDMIEPAGIASAHLVREEKVDAALVNYDGEPLPDLHYQRITARPVKFVVWNEHPLAARASISLAEAAQIPLVLPSENFFVTRLLTRAAAARHLSFNVLYYSPHLSTLHSLLRTHTAPSILFEQAIASLKDVTAVPFDEPLSLTSCLITKKNRQIPKDLRLVLKFIREQLTNAAPPLHGMKQN
ncbi:MAG: LysR family transcriptional regulator [Selenomonadaceae bacterium]|nr:LysR family transcriptional regulator [Selenomonadaceae bacterium]